MQAWTACRMIGEAASAARPSIRRRSSQDMKSPDFGVAAYKGPKLSLRDWDWQLRQPITAVRRPHWSFRSRRSRASCTRSRNSTRSASTGRRPNASCDEIACSPRLLAAGCLSPRRRHTPTPPMSPTSATTRSAWSISTSMKTVKTIPVGQRPRGITMTQGRQRAILVCASDDDTIQIIDTKTLQIVGDLPSGPDPETFALHASAIRSTSPTRTTTWSRHRRADAQGDRRRSRPASSRRAWRSAPTASTHREHLRNHQHGAFHRLRDHARWWPTCWSMPRPRYRAVQA